MWALGVMLFTLLSGHLPFLGEDEKDLFYNIKKVNFKYPKIMSREARFVISKLIEPDTRFRYRASDLLRINWI